MNDHEAMLAIQELMDGTEWTVGTIDGVAAIMRAAGYRLRHMDDVDPEEG